MSDIRIKMAKDLRDMSDMVGDLHWMAAKAVEDLIKKDARIVELEEQRDRFMASIERKHKLMDEDAAEIDQLRAELAALKAQEPVESDYYRGMLRAVLKDIRDEIPRGGLPQSWNDIADSISASLHRPFNAAPVSEAKAQGVVMPEPMKRGDEGGSGEYGAAMIRGYNACLREVARLNAAPVQQVSVPDERAAFEVQFPLEDGVEWNEADQRYEAFTAFDRSRQHAVDWQNSMLEVWQARAMLAAAPAAPSHGEQVREIKRLREAFTKMRNVAAGYSNHCEDSASTRRYEREFTAADDLFLSIVPSAGSQEQG